MTRKISAHGRKLKRTGGGFNGAAWAKAITLCQPHGDDLPVVIPGLIEGTQSTADNNKLRVRAAFDELKAGRLPAGNEAAFDVISIALSLACIRAGQIAGEVVADNQLLSVLVPGNLALRRCLDRRRRWGKWQLDQTGAIDLLAAIEVYEAILQESSPAQMLAAEDIQRAWLRGQTLETVN